MNLAWLFPYRSHLEAEIEYLRAQCAQKDRRIHELQEALAEIAKPAPKVYLQPETRTKIRVQPKGWDAFRADRKMNPPEEDYGVPGTGRAAVYQPNGDELAQREPEGNGQDAVSATESTA